MQHTVEQGLSLSPMLSRESWASLGTPSLKCTPLHFHVEDKESKMWVLGKVTIIMHHQMLEIVANGDLNLALS